MKQRELIDRHGRRIEYLRISVTDRCNLRCTYCMPEGGIPLLPRDHILTLEEIERFARIAASAGINKIRLTGGEPLVRRGVVDLVSRLAAIPGLKDLSMTTNGVLLAEAAEDLKRAGLCRVNVSMDSLNPETYREITRGQDIGRVLEGMSAAADAGLLPVSINVVLHQRTIEELASFMEMIGRMPVRVRFIEKMDVSPQLGCGMPGGIPAERMREAVLAQGYREDDGRYGYGPARYYRRADEPGRIGIIFHDGGRRCSRCNRIRLTADGLIKPCLLSDERVDVRGLMRSGEPDDRIASAIVEALERKPEDSSCVKNPNTRAMARIGG